MSFLIMQTFIYPTIASTPSTRVGDMPKVRVMNLRNMSYLQVTLNSEHKVQFMDLQKERCSLETLIKPVSAWLQPERCSSETLIKPVRAWLQPEQCSSQTLIKPLSVWLKLECTDYRGVW